MGILRRAPVVAALALAALLSSCADDDPRPLETTTPPVTVTASASPTATAPALPAAATPDPKGAEAFVRYFWDVFNYTYLSLDTRLLRSISGSGCKFCASSADGIDKWAEQKASVTGSQVTVSSVAAPPADYRKSVLVTSLVQQESGEVRSPGGQVISSGDGMPRKRSDVLIRYTDGRWEMEGISFGGPEGEGK